MNETPTRRKRSRFQRGFSRGAFRGQRAAAYCDVSYDTWQRWNAAGKIPAPMKLAGIVLWGRDELDDWIAAGMPARDEWEERKKAAVRIYRS
jgi:predicted DNA-binding transcriptional regulator AlpA